MTLAPANTQTVGSSIVTLDDYTFTAAEIDASQVAYITPKGGDVLYMVNGDDPTTDHCHIFPDGVTSQINHRAKTLKMLRATVDAVVTVELAPNEWPR